MDDLETCPAIVHERHDEGFDQINVRAQGIENVVKVLPGHLLWGCFLDIGVAACLFSCKKHGFLFCGHHSFLRVRFFFPHKASVNESFFTASSCPHLFPSRYQACLPNLLIHSVNLDHGIAPQNAHSQQQDIQDDILMAFSQIYPRSIRIAKTSSCDLP